MPRFQSCNIVKTESGQRELWQFTIGGQRTLLQETRKLPLHEPLPNELVAKDWNNLFRPRLNIAWLPPDQVFLRVLHLPPCDAEEVQSMVELQLEKVSPLPLGQIAWAYERLPSTREDLQTVVVVIAPRTVVADYLGQLEEHGFVADRLEMPLVHQLRSVEFDWEGAYVLPGTLEEHPHALVAWYYGGALQHVSLLLLPPLEQASRYLKTELANMAWAGEIEGWLTQPPRFTLVAGDLTAERWSAMLREAVEDEVRLISSVGESELAAGNARDAAKGVLTSNLLPDEFAVRYRQQYADRLWMRGLGGVVAAYVICVLIYLGALQVFQFQHGELEEEITSLSGSYTNAQHVKARMQVLQQQVELKFLALDVWKAVAEWLPGELTLQHLAMKSGGDVNISGICRQEDISKVTDYNEALSQATVDGEPLFRSVRDRGSSTRAGPMGPQTVIWQFQCELLKTGFE